MMAVCMVALPSYNLGVALHLHSVLSSLLGPCRAQKRWGSLHLKQSYGKEERNWVGHGQGKAGTVDPCMR